MITAFLILLPLLSGLIICFLNGQKARNIAFGVTVLEFIESVIAFYKFHTPEGQTQLELNTPWISKLGISFYLSMDGIGILLVMLTTFLVPLIILSTFNREYKNSGLFYGLILVMQSALVGVFVAKDAFLFYVFWELALIPIYFISLLWGGADRLKVTFKFFIYTLFGSLFMLVALIYLYTLTDPAAHTFSIDAFYKLELSPVQQMWVFWALFLAFAIKMPIFPFHTWQPDTYTTSPTAGTMLLSGIMLKMGIFGVIRWMLPIVPYAINDQWGGRLAITLCVIGIIYASVIALLQKDFKRLIAYVSIAHVGLIAAGVFTMSFEGVQGAVIQMVSHGINVVGLFFAIDIIISRTKTRELSELGGIRSVAPQFTTLFLIVVFSSIALPFTSGFIGEFLLFVSLSKFNMWLTAIAGISIILGALYMLQSFQKSMLGETSEKTAVFEDLRLNEKLVFIPLIAMIFWIGLYPKLFLDTAEPTVQKIVEQINNTYTLK